MGPFAELPSHARTADVKRKFPVYVDFRLTRFVRLCWVLCGFAARFTTPRRPGSRCSPGQRQMLILEEMRRAGRSPRQRADGAARRVRHDGPPRPRRARRSRASSKGARRRDGSRPAERRRAGLRGEVAPAAAEKEAIARAAGGSSSPGRRSALTAGHDDVARSPTTSLDVPDLTVVTNSIQVANVLHASSGPT